MGPTAADYHLQNSLDFQGLGKLRAEAARNQDGALREVAQQFEAMFLQMMMKSMRQAVPRSELIDSASIRTFEAMQDQELAGELSRAGGIGLADMLVEQLGGASAAGPSIPGAELRSTEAVGLPLTDRQPTAFQIQRAQRAYGMESTQSGAPLRDQSASSD